MLRKLRLHVFEGKGRADLYTLGPANAVLFAEITDEDGFLLHRVESRNSGGTGLRATPAFLSEAALVIYHHVELLMVIVDNGRIERARLFTLTLFVRTLAAHVLDGLGGWKKVSVDTDTRELPVDHAVMEHGAGYLAITAPDAEVPAGIDERHPFRVG